MPPARVMVTCQKCGRGIDTGQIIPEPKKTKPIDQPIRVVTCSNCGHQDAYGANDFQLAPV